MICPVCGTELQEMVRSTVSIDVCPRCKGVWLDRGELEKLLEMEAAGMAAAPGPRGPFIRHDDHDDEHGFFRGHGHGHDHDHDDHDDHDRYGRPRRRGFLGGIFDRFGDD